MGPDPVALSHISLCSPGHDLWYLWEHRAWSSQPRVWWRARFPLTAPQSHAAWYFSRPPRKGSAVFLVCTYNSFPTAIFFPCSVLNIRVSLTHWVSVRVSILCLHISLHLVPWCFSSNSSFSACIWDQYYFTSLFWLLMLSSQQLFQCGTLWEQLLIPLQEPLFSLAFGRLQVCSSSSLSACWCWQMATKLLGVPSIQVCSSHGATCQAGFSVVHASHERTEKKKKKKSF